MIESARKWFRTPVQRSHFQPNWNAEHKFAPRLVSKIAKEPRDQSWQLRLVDTDCVVTVTRKPWNITPGLLVGARDRRAMPFRLVRFLVQEHTFVRLVGSSGFPSSGMRVCRMKNGTYLISNWRGWTINARADFVLVGWTSSRGNFNSAAYGRAKTLEEYKVAESAGLTMSLLATRRDVRDR